jgi:ABC-2 type transport system permease protein
VATASDRAAAINLEATTMATMAIESEAVAPAMNSRPLAGAGNIARKELQEWFRTWRFVVTAGLTSLLLGAVPVVLWIHRGGLHDGRLTLPRRTYDGMMDAWIGLSLTLGAYLVVGMTMGMMAKEREAGTAQWLFTKPVSRAGYGLAKWAANSVAVVVGSVLIPSAVFFGLVEALFGVQHSRGAVEAVGLVALNALTVIALVVGLSGLFNSPPLIGGIVVAMYFVPLLVAGAVSHKYVGLFPVWMGNVAHELAVADRTKGWDWEPVWSCLVIIPVCLAFACYRLRRAQLQ